MKHHVMFWFFNLCRSAAVFTFALRLLMNNFLYFA